MDKETCVGTPKTSALIWVFEKRKTCGYTKYKFVLLLYFKI